MIHADLHVSVLQLDVAWQQPERNMQAVASYLSQIQGTELCLLPEMWTTGFVTRPEGVADASTSALQWMQEKAAQFNMALCGTVAVEEPSEPNRYFNRMYFVTPEGETAVYNKRHLFSMGGEHEHFSAGTERVIVLYKGVRWLLLTCYDLRFPVWIRNRGDYDGILIAANWPQPRRAVWDILLKARAIENQCFVVAANRVGDDPAAHYNGGSTIIDAKGKTMAMAEDDIEQTVSARLSLIDHQRFVGKFNTLADADTFQLNI